MSAIKKKLFGDSVESKLLKVSYSETVSEEQEQSLMIYDSYEIIEIKESELKIKFIRKVDYNDENGFSLVVETEIVRNGADGVKLNKKLNNDNIKEYLDDIICISFNFVSNLISNITASFGKMPIITPPIFIKDEE